MDLISASSSAGAAYSGPVADIAFSIDSTRLFIAAGDRILSVDAATGEQLGQYAFAQPVGAIDMAPGGRYLAALVFAPDPLTATVTTIARIDTLTGQVTSFPVAIAGAVQSIFLDLAFLDDGTLLLSQQGPAAPLIRFDFASASLVVTPETFTNATLIASRDHGEVLVLDGSAKGTIAVYDADGGITATHVADPEAPGGAGGPDPVAAIAPSGERFIVGNGLASFDSLLAVQPHADPEIALIAAGMDFNPATGRLLVADGDTLLEIDPQTLAIVATYPLGGFAADPFDNATGTRIGMGNILKVSPDGERVAIIRSDGVGIISLDDLQPQAGPADDILVEGSLLVGLAGNDVLGGPDDAQRMHGGPGNDTYLVGQPGDSVHELPGQGHDSVKTTIPFALSPDVEDLAFVGQGDGQLIGNDSANTIAGGPGHDRISGRGGDDTLLGGPGNDDLDGGTGSDIMIGGDGDDIYQVDSANDAVIEAIGGGNDEVRTSLASFTVPANVERLTGIGEVRQVLTGDGHANVITSGPQADRLVGLGGDDHYFVTNSGDVVVEAAGGGRDTVHAAVSGFSLPSHVEDLALIGEASDGSGNELDNVLTAGAVSGLLRGLGGNDRLEGGDGDDTLDGGTGADLMIGGKGDDHYLVDNAGDIAFENPDEGTDEIVASFDYTLGASFENLVLIDTAVLGVGNDAGNVIVGNSLDNILRGLGGDDRLEGGDGNDMLEGGVGDDLLIGGAGADTMVGGAGADTYIVDDPGDVVSENANEGRDLVETSASFVLPQNVEDLRVTGGPQIEVFANGFANRITVDATQARVNALGGSDEFRVTGGGNLLDGGAGIDRIIFDGPRNSWGIAQGEGSSLLTQATGIAGIDANQLTSIEVMEFTDGKFVWSPQWQKAVQVDNGQRHFNLFLPDGFAGVVGGSGTIFGSNGVQDITLANVAGTIVLDPSFSRGGDILRLPGNAAKWGGVVLGSTATLSNGDSSVEIPIGSEMLSVVFADGTRTLRFDGASGSVKFGTQSLDETFAVIDSVANAATPAPLLATDALAKAFLSGPGGMIFGGNGTIFGNSDSQVITLTGGTVGFDPTFGAGGDTIVLPGEATQYTAVQSGVSVYLASEAARATIPVGQAHLALDFDDGERDLHYDSVKAAIVIEGQVIPTFTVNLVEIA